MPADRIQIRLGPGPLTSAVAARGGAADNGSASEVARRDLGRYYDLLALALASVDLTEGEASLIVDALNGTIIDVSTAQLLAAEVEDGLGDGLAEKWGVDGGALVAKVRAWTLAQRMAVCDAAERFWGDEHHVDSTGDRLAAVGLVRRG